MYMYLLVEVCTGKERYRPAHTGMYMRVPHTSTYQDIPVCPGMEKQDLVGTGSSTYWYVLVCHGTSMYWYILVRTRMYWYIPACTTHISYTYILLEYTDTNWNIPGCPFWYTLILPCILLSSSGYEAVQGGTRQ